MRCIRVTRRTRRIGTRIGHVIQERLSYQRWCDTSRCNSRDWLNQRGVSWCLVDHCRCLILTLRLSPYLSLSNHHGFHHGQHLLQPLFEITNLLSKFHILLFRTCHFPFDVSSSIVSAGGFVLYSRGHLCFFSLAEREKV